MTAACDGGVVELRDHEGTTCVSGTAWRARGGLLDRVLRPMPLPDDRPAASEDTLAIGTMLGSIEREATVDAIERYLEAIGDDAAWWRDRDLVHPGWLLLDANNVLARNVRLGPWIHAASRVRLLRPVPLGAALETRAEVVDAYDRKGHRFVELDVVTLIRGTPDGGERGVAGDDGAPHRHLAAPRRAACLAGTAAHAFFAFAFQVALVVLDPAVAATSSSPKTRLTSSSGRSASPANWL